jgi:hypothetical protein
MPVRPPRFAPIPNVPQQGLSDWQFQTLNAMKENIELLTGAKDRGSVGLEALTRSTVTVNNAPTQNMQRISADGSGFSVQIPVMTAEDTQIQVVTEVNLSIDFTDETFSLSVVTEDVPVGTDYTKLIADVANVRGGVNGIRTPNLDDYARLLSDVQTLANDVATLRNAVNALINQLKG